jgi:hypothetical protein
MPTHTDNKAKQQSRLAQTSLIEHFAPMRDPRIDRRKDHDLIDVLIIAVCCLLCGGEGFNDMEDFGEAKHDWFKTFLRPRSGIPSHDTFNRVFAVLDPKEFLELERSARGYGNLRPRGAQSLGLGKQSVLDHGRMLPRRSKSRSLRPCGRKPGYLAQARPEPTQTRANEKARHQRQTTQCRLGSRLFAPFTGHLDASALFRIELHLRGKNKGERKRLKNYG